ncbi:MAG: hypothetical protein IJC33_00010 [Clostridia bacterium]|nr:hypothetical protein [Clostridia bacterium]
MRRTKMKVLLPVLCAVVMLISVFGSLMVSGGAIMPWRDDAIGVEKILERDGYIEGIWYPWFKHENLGHGLTGNDLFVEYVGSSWASTGFNQYGAANIYREIYNLKALGFNVLGYEGSPYGEGVIYDANGDVLGVKEDYLENIRALLDICREVGMPVLWSICFHTTSANDYYKDGKLAWDIVSQAYCNPEVADHYAERFAKPVCEVLAEYPDVVVLVASGVELENEINDSDIGNHFDGGRVLYGVNQDDMLYFINAVNNVVADVLPDVGRTNCANMKDMSIYRDLDAGFDFMGVNNYSHNAGVPSVESLQSPNPVIMTEFGLGDGAVEDEIWTIRQVQFRDNLIANGYAGWMMWCWSPNGYGGNYDLLAADAKSTSDFRAGAFTLRYYIDEYRAAHRGEEIVLDKPTLFANTGSGAITWIPSRQASEMDLLRSMDSGKTWEKILDNVDPYEYATNGKGHYEDEFIAKWTEGGTVMYKIVVRDSDGNVAESEPNNEMEILGPPINLVTNGSFETGDMTAWEDWGEQDLENPENSKYGREVVKLDDAPDGEYAIRYWCINDQEWFGFNQPGITVKPNTNYKITYKYKNIGESASAYCFIRTLDSAGNGTGDGTIYDAQPESKYLNLPKDGEWHEDVITIRTGETDKLGIDFRVIKGSDFYVDDIVLVEVR